MVKIKDPIVSVDWLHAHIDASNLIILDASIPKVVGNMAELANEQIPHARFFDIKKDFSDVSGEFPNTCPSTGQFQEAAQKLGINQDSAIVVYDTLGIYSCARAWWLFKVFGHDNVAVLDGGLPEWENAGFDVEAKTKKDVLRGDFIASYTDGRMCFFDDIVRISSNESSIILDARSEARFKAMVPEPRKGLRSGTIPSSKHLSYTSVLDNAKMTSKSELRRIFSKFGPSDAAFVFSCGSGITACILALGAAIANYKNLTVYDGSWTEYGSLTEE